jgi:hypothetical protein
VSDLLALRGFVSANSDADSSDGPFATFGNLGLTVGNFESVEFFVDGETADLDASAPQLTVAPAAGDEDTAFALDIQAALTDTDGSEVLSVTVSGLPAGATLSAGELNEDGSVTLSPAQLSGLTVTPPTGSDIDFTLTVIAVSRETATGLTAQSSASLGVTVAAVADVPTLSAAPASGDEDAAIALDIQSALTDTDGSEVLLVTVSGLPAGAALSAGSANADGSVTLTASELAGLTVTPPADSEADFTLTVNAQTRELANGATAQVSASLPVSVAAVADAPDLAVSAATGAEDTAIALDIQAALTDTDGSEVLSVTVSGLPAGAVLSAGSVNADGSVTLTASQLVGLTVTPSADSDAEFALTVTAQTRELANGAATDTSVSLPVNVAAVADAPVLSVNSASGAEDTAIALDIQAALTDTDGSEVLSVTVSGLPAGATLSAGTINDDGSVTLTVAELSGLTVKPPVNSDADFTLIVTAQTMETANGAIADSVTVLPVSVQAVADAPELAVTAATGDEDTPIALDIHAALTDTDGSEILSATVSGLPAGAVLSAGTLNDDGSVTLTPSELSNLTVMPPPDSPDDFILSVSATTRDGADTETVSVELPVDVRPVSDAPVLSQLNDITVQLKPTVFTHELTTTASIQEATAQNTTGVDRSDLSFAHDHSVKVTFVDEDAGNKNTIGFYRVDADGTIGEVSILWENASKTGSGGNLVANQSAVDIDVLAGERISFFIVANGFQKNDFTQFSGGHFAFLANGVAATTGSVRPALVYIGDDGSSVAVSGDVFHATDIASALLSSGGKLHGRSGVDTETGGLVISFEDQSNLGDRDFNDLTIRIDFSNSIGSVLEPVSVAPGISLSDIDSTALSAASVTLVDGFAEGDEIQLGSLEGTGVSVAQQGFDDASGTYRLMLTGEASIETYEGILASLQLTGTTAGTRRFEFGVTDGEGAQSVAVTTDVTVNPVDAQSGTSADDIIAGAAANDALSGGGGNDAIAGNGGADAVLGGDGDDDLTVGDGSFVLAAGDAGTDTLHVGFDLDLTVLADNRISGIEQFDLRDGTGSMLTIGIDDVLAATAGTNALTGEANSLVVRRDAEDTVTLVGDGWTQSTDTLDADNNGTAEGYTVFHDSASGATVYVENPAQALA